MKIDALKKHLPLLSLILIAFVLRLPLLNSSFWLDEAAQAMESARPWSEQFNIAYDFQPPLLHVITHFFLQVSFQEWWLRIPSLIAGVFTVVFTYLIGKKLLNPLNAWLSAFLLSIHSLHIFYSQELRPYSLATLWAVMSWYLILQLSEHKKQTSRGIPFLMLYALSTLAGMYSTYLYPFLVLSQIIYVLCIKREHLKKLFTSWIVVAIGFIPWLPKLFEQFLVAGELRQKTQGWESVVSFGPVKSLLLVVGKFTFGVSDLELNLLYGVCLILLAIFSFIVVKKIPIKKTKHIEEFLMLICWIGIPLVTAWIVSLWVPLIQPKRVLFLLPAGLLLFMYLIEKSTQKSIWKKALLGFFISIQLFSVIQYWITPAYQREDWREVITTINDQFDPSNTAVVFAFDEAFAPWEWYQVQPLATFTTGTATLTNIEQLDDSLHFLLEYDQVLVFDYLRDLTDPQHFIDQWLVTYGYSEVGHLVKPEIGFIRIYKKGKDAKVAIVQ